MEQEIKNLIKKSLKNLNIEAGDISLEHPVDLKMGDYSTNVAMALAKKEKTNPKELAEKIVNELKNLSSLPAKGEVGGGLIEKIEQANGFINFYLSKEFFTESIKEILENKNFANNDLFFGKKIMIEYTQPNPFKPFHIGHLMSNAIGESLSRIFEVSGARVIRANYQGDVGPHVAKAIYGLQKFGMPNDSLSISAQAEYVGECYSKGSNLYDTDESAKKEIDIINKKIYDRSDEKINKIYDWGRKLTLEAFEELYKTLGTKFDKYYFESVMAKRGEKIVEKNISNLFEKSDGAVVFHAEKYDPKLHTRVFINSQGLPTYETKELGLTMSKFKSGLFSKSLDMSIVTTAIEQGEYMKVVQKAISIMHPELEKKMKHITHGMMRLSTGKMSSRKGNVTTGESLIKDSKAEILEKIKDRDFTGQEKENIASIVGIAALKYSILKQAIGGDIVYDFDKSISFEGDSGPYLQYSYTRAKSILNKAEKEKVISSYVLPENWETTEVEKILYKFPEVVAYSMKEFEPHHIANYLIELARAFNGFYGNTQIVKMGDETSSYKVGLTEAFSLIMKEGLYLLGIKVPERM